MTMTTLFTSILNMSITASYVVIAVIIMRIFFKKLPKIYSYVLWLPVLIRLICPFSFSSAISFFSFIKPENQASTRMMEYVPYNIGMSQIPAIDVGINPINNAINGSLPPATPLASANPMQIIMGVASDIWAIGIVILLIYSGISYLKVVSKVKTATIIKDNVFETDRITTPFVFGFLRPKIYIPVGINENELPYILAYEQTHINRLDHLVKPLGFLVLILHWFNPLIWLAFALMSKDMEMSCDEKVIKDMDKDRKGGYSKALLSLSVDKNRFLAGSPLAFGESNVKSRIKNIVSYKKPAFLVTLVIVIATAVLIAAFTANPKNEQTAPSGSYLGYSLDTLLDNKTPYVGNNSRVIALMDAMPLPTGIVRNTINLHTNNPPYGITVNLIMNDAIGVTVDGAISGDAFSLNSILLFSLIDNVDIIKYEIIDKTGKYDGTSYSFPFTREQAEKLVGRDMAYYASGIAELQELIDRFNSILLIEKHLGVIISSPPTSSNPDDYIKAHQNEYENILKMGDEALDYLLAQFEKSSDNNNLRGHIMMALCKDLLGERNNVTEENLLPQEWFNQLSIYEEIKLPDFKANVSDPIEQMVYDAAMQQYADSRHGFTVVAPTILGSYEEGNKLKFFVTVFTHSYQLYNKTLVETSGGVIPGAITFSKNMDGSYTLDEYLEARDGSDWSKSIKAYCKMPVTKKEIKGLYDKILDDYGSNQNRSELLRKNLIEHLKKYGQNDVALKHWNGESEQLT